MKKTKVVHVITLLELGGAQQNTLFTCTQLNRDSFEVVLICGKGGILDEEAQKIPDLKIHFVKELVREVRPWKDFLAFINLTRILKQEQADIVHTHSSKAGILARIAAWLAKTPVVIHSIHGFGFNPYQKFFVRGLFVFLEQLIARITNKFIAVSRENIDLGLKLKIGTPNQYILIRSGVNIQKIKKEAQTCNPQDLRKELNIPNDFKIVLTVGPFKIQKDPLAFVRLSALVAQRFPQVKFLMVGDGELRNQIEDLIRTLKVQQMVQLLGWRRDIPQLMKLCDVFVMTSLWEGLPRAGVEALIIGKPVVAFGVNGIPEIVKDGQNGFVLNPGQIQTMAERLLQVLQDSALAARLSENALKSIDDSFDIYNMVRQQEELYLDLE